MREIKFRCYHFDYEKMIYSPAISFWSEQEDDPIEVEGYSPKEDPDVVVLMQFTGLLDKNGKEIYEGDIVRADEVDFMTVLDVERRRFIPDSVVEFDKGAFRVFKGDLDYYLNQVGIEVIGNIYSNPELLTQRTN